ncbi:hypothetical protein BIY37_09730 [Candidatus Brocadia sapporoensis]|uniref:Uncharacterized protein n=1 Tax=Candidatus Brocadia sapporoensis TaxID=392547 RepID=A0A1V6LYF8_9BACT|nr:hypothetical protein [Candidatus Brocadia sapporoensis]OQD45184.1 hypothetical protein BIY37_09730 [Candidatus Brocadia sapporoensis]
MNGKQPINHAQRVGKVANLTIFLGILGIILSFLALTISKGLAQRGYGFSYLTIGLCMMALGYGIRYRSKYCLYATMVLFVTLSCNFFFQILYPAYDVSYLPIRFMLLDVLSSHSCSSFNANTHCHKCLSR